jgi:cell division inhibitor SepF
MSAGMWHRTLVYLGLKEEPEEGYDDPPERLAPETPRRRTSRPPAALTPIEEVEQAVEPASNVRALHGGEVAVRTPGGAVGAPLRTPVIEILVFDDVEAVGARYRTGQPVLFDLSKADAKVGRRVIDFVSGLTYVSRGGLRRVSARAFLLVPEGIELPEHERERLADLGYHVGPDA